MRAKHQDVSQLELWPDKGKHRETVVDKVASYKQTQTSSYSVYGGVFASLIRIKKGVPSWRKSLRTSGTFNLFSLPLSNLSR